MDLVLLVGIKKNKKYIPKRHLLDVSIANTSYIYDLDEHLKKGDKKDSQEEQTEDKLSRNLQVNLLESTD